MQTLSQIARLALLGATLSLPALAQAAPGTAGAGKATPATKPPLEGPCASAATLVGGHLRKPLRGAQLSALAHRPLYEAELALDPAEGMLTGRLRITVASDWTGPLILVLPVEGGTSASPFEWKDAKLSRAGGEARPAVARGSEGHLIFDRLPGGEGPLTLSLALTATLPSLGTPGLTDAYLALQPGPTTFDLGSLVSHRLGATLREAYPVLLEEKVEATRAPAPWGAPLPSPAACHLVSVEVPRTHEVRASGQQVGRIPDASGKVRYVFAAADLRRFSLVALPVDRASADGDHQGVKIRVSAESEASAKKLLAWTRSALGSLEAEWGAYPFGRLEVATVPLSGAVDGLRGGGLVLVSTVFEGDGDLGAMASLSESGGGADLQELTLVHQLAHQWIGEAVATPGPAQPVLEELVANYGLMRHAARRHGNDSAKALADAIMAKLYQTWRALGSRDAAADQPFEALGLGGWVGLCAGKASLLLPRAEATFGARPVRRAVRKWLTEGRRETRDRASLEAALASALPIVRRREVGPFFARHLDQIHGDEDLGLGDFGAFGNLGGMLPPGMVPPGMGLPPGGMGPMDDAALQQLLQEMFEALGGP